MRVLITGAAGFIGSNLVHHLLSTETRAAGIAPEAVIAYDALTYAGSLLNLAEVRDDPRLSFVHADIRDRSRFAAALEEHAIDLVLHLAAESHVDRSIDGPAEFLDTNILGTFQLLEAARERRSRGHPLRLLHVSTDEVYGTLGEADPAFSETTPYAPNSPYSASKAASDHLVRAWHHTYGLDVVTTNCSNNYGPRQFPEKLIPLMIAKALTGQPLPLYGDGSNRRDWLHVRDHAAAIWLVAREGRGGETYNVGGNSERSNLEVVRTLLALLRKRGHGQATEELIAFVTDRPGHDWRYAIDTRKIEAELGWRPAHSFEEGMAQTVDWYLAHGDWSRQIAAEKYSGRRLGLD